MIPAAKPSVKPSTNGTGIIQIGRKGMKKFQFGDDGQPFEVDVTQVWNDFISIADHFRGEDGNVPRDKADEHNRAIAEYVADKSKMPVGELSLSEVLEFQAVIMEEAEKLRDFFDVALRKKRGLPGSSVIPDCSTATSSPPV